MSAIFQCFLCATYASTPEIKKARENKNERTKL